MKTQVRVDYHFHPNFTFSLPWHSKRKAKKIWKEFGKNNLNAVLIAEHSYKKPKKSFELLEKTKPKSTKTTLIPAVEVLTKEGTDIIAFAKRPDQIYSNTYLLKPWKLSTEQVIRIIKNDKNLYGIVVHPYTPGTTSMIRNLSEDLTIKAIKELRFVEGHNYSFSNSTELFKNLKLNKLLKSKYEQMKKTLNAPGKLTKEAKIITTGSDAHHLWGIGDCTEIETNKPKNLDELFKIITTIPGKPFLKKKSKIRCLFSWPTYIFEWLLKKSYKLKLLLRSTS